MPAASREAAAMQGIALLWHLPSKPFTA
ncbi:hypothetical protein C7H19_24540 [Aphanothece hegewaldii CCALA 016]|uniref:Uncharacterized protein n=1 Tax=Aphanothece hegewaldii CCALA 016 TaxID=2107694 RepID=A0A2T1LQM5_9CHRO|nr:hypothetical protein C7H19_24540 [Aphanothece hegewaldii CCALA 016]